MGPAGCYGTALIPLVLSSSPCEHPVAGSISAAKFGMSSSLSVSCEHCGETFHRREHRDRHLLRHTGARPFLCHICSKTFSRNDTLVRHLALHQRSSHGSHRRERANSSGAIGRRRVQACVQCARLKQRCDGGLPCSRCLVRKSDCSYAASQVCTKEVASPSSLNPCCDVETSGGELLACTTPLLHLESPEFDDFSSQEAAPVGMANSSDMAHLTPAMDFAFPWAFPWPMEDLDFRMHDPGLLLSLDSGTTSTTVGPNYLSPQNIWSRYAIPCPSFPEPQAVSLEIAGAEIYGHVDRIPEQGFGKLHDFYRTQQQTPSLSPPLPPRILHAFVELYFEHFDRRFPVLHKSRLGTSDTPWVLLLATAAVGSHYSEIPQASEYNLVLCELLERAVESLLLVQITRTDVVTVQAVFLLHVLWMFSGSHRDKIVQRYKKSVVATLCHDLLGILDRQDNCLTAQADPAQEVETEWQNWLAAEEQVRLLSCVRGETSTLVLANEMV